MWEKRSSCRIWNPHDLLLINIGKVCLSNEAVLVAKEQKKNKKNHFRPIPEQACALGGKGVRTRILSFSRRFPWLEDSLNVGSSLRRQCIVHSVPIFSSPYFWTMTKNSVYLREAIFFCEAGMVGFFHS